jgi:L-arabinose 1-dehydrogenase [NAD(P)+]
MTRNILLTGAAGYTGRGIDQVLRTRHQVRGLDLTAGDGSVLCGDLTDLDVCRTALRSMDAMVLCHMARNPDQYATPGHAFDINVKGTANLYHAAAECGVRHAVLISSTAVRQDPAGGGPPCRPGVGPYRFSDLYALTKVFQEQIARQCWEMHGIATTILRPAWIVYDGDLTSKYGERVTQYQPILVDPRDIGRAVLAALELPNPKLEAFELGQDDSQFDLAPVRLRLRWRPRHRFAALRSGVPAGPESIPR